MLLPVTDAVTLPDGDGDTLPLLDVLRVTVGLPDADPDPVLDVL